MSSSDKAGLTLGLSFHAIIILVALWDLVAIYASPEFHTVTWWIRKVSHDYPLLAYLTWFTLGHIFWGGE